MNIFETVKAAVTFRQAADYYGLKVNRSSMACCPFHDDRYPSLKLNEDYLYRPDALKPVLWLSFLNGLLYPEDIPTLQEFIGYCLIPSNKGQRLEAVTAELNQKEAQLDDTTQATEKKKSRSLNLYKRRPRRQPQQR